MAPTHSSTKLFNSICSQAGFSFMEILVTLTLFSGSYLVISSTQQWVSTSSIRQEQMLRELLLASDEHELKMALALHEDEE